MPIRSLGLPSINLRVTSRIASTRVASCPPIVKSFVSMDPETSSTSMMSIPLALIWVRLLPSCGRASATTKAASESSSSVRRILPARAALCFPIALRLAVDEYVSAAAGPRFPRKYASKGIASSNSSSHGRANVSALFAGQKSNRFVMSSEVETSRDFQDVQHEADNGQRFLHFGRNDRKRLDTNQTVAS